MQVVILFGLLVVRLTIRVPISTSYKYILMFCYHVSRMPQHLHTIIVLDADSIRDID